MQSSYAQHIEEWTAERSSVPTPMMMQPLPFRSFLGWEVPRWTTEGRPVAGSLPRVSAVLLAAYVPGCSHIAPVRYHITACLGYHHPKGSVYCMARLCDDWSELLFCVLGPAAQSAS